MRSLTDSLAASHCSLTSCTPMFSMNRATSLSRLAATQAAAEGEDSATDRLSKASVLTCAHTGVRQGDAWNLQSLCHSC